MVCNTVLSQTYDPETGELIQKPDTTSFDPETGKPIVKEKDGASIRGKKMREITPGMSEMEIKKTLDSREAINKNKYKNKLLREVEQSENDRLQRQEASKDTEKIYSIGLSKSELKSITRDEIDQYLDKNISERLRKIIQQENKPLEAELQILKNKENNRG